MATEALVAISADSELTRRFIERRALRPNGVDIAIKFCGICHGDLHMARAFSGQRLPVRSRARNSRDRHGHRPGCEGLCIRRYRRGGMHGRQLPHMPTLPE